MSLLAHREARKESFESQFANFRAEGWSRKKEPDPVIARNRKAILSEMGFDQLEPQLHDSKEGHILA